MAFSKSKLYPDDDQIISGFMKALDHPARLQILRRLAKEGPITVEELREDHPICRSALSGHLRTLRKADLVTWKEKYPSTYYAINGKAITIAEKYLGDFFKDL